MAEHHNGVWKRRGAGRIAQMTRRSVAWPIVTLGVVILFILAACGAPSGPAVAPQEAAPAAENPPAAAPEPATESEPAAEQPAPAASGAAVPGVTDSEIVIGSWGPQDGPAGAYGIINRIHAAYFEMLNENGGINGRTVRFVYENDSYQPSRTVAAVRKLVEEDQIFALVGGLGTPNNMAVMEYLVENNVPHVAPSTGSTLMALPLKRNVFALQLNYTTEAALLTQYALDELGSQSIAVFYQNDDFGKEGLESVNRVLEARGLPEAIGVSYEPADTNFSSQALRLQTSGADTVIIWAVPRPGGAIIQEMTQIGFEPNLMASSVIQDPAIFELAGPGIEGLILAAWLPDYNDTSNPKIMEYREFMQEHLPNEIIGGFSLTGYTQAQLMEEALRRAGDNLTRDNLIAVLESMQGFDGTPLPSISYTADDHQGTKAAFFQQAQGGTFISISDFITLEE